MPNASHKATLSVDEVIQVLNRSSLPTLVIEGSDDLIVYRRLEERFQDSFLSVLPVGGRLRVLELYERRNEMIDNHNIAFIADKDLWVISGIPEAYKSIQMFFSDGYSIENDVYWDGNFEMLMDQQERVKFRSELLVYLKWYACALLSHLSGNPESLDIHPDRFFRPGIPPYTGTEPSTPFPDDLYEKLVQDYPRLLRGKSLISLLLRQISHSSRSVKHNRRALLETVAAEPGPLLQKIYSDVGSYFSPS